MKKIIVGVFTAIWFVIALFVTLCLLSYNDYKVPTFNKTSLIIIDSDSMEPDYYEGDLLVIKKTSNEKINVNDKIFYYDASKSTTTLINYGEVDDKEDINKNESTYTIDGIKVSSEYVIGSSKSTKLYSKLGFVLSIFLSKWGFMFLVIFPTLFAIIYEVVMIVDSIRNDKGEE